MKLQKVRHALISVSDKTGLEEFARVVSETYNVAIFSTGGTFRFLKEKGIPVKKVEDLTRTPEILGGRVKTLHPAVFAGILARRNEDSDMKTLEEMGYPAFDLVVVNLYPFTDTIKKENVTEAECIENIDIGGVALLRAAAKNMEFVTVISSPEDYTGVINEMEYEKGIREETRGQLAQKAFQHTAEYDAAIATYLSKNNELPEVMTLGLKRSMILRYGENPHQRAAFYLQPKGSSLLEGDKESSVAHARQLHGKELSYNNISDTDGAWELVREFEEPAVAIIKHANPCGVGRASSMVEAYKLALECDPVSAFGGIVALNRTVDKPAAEEIAKIFTEVVIAPKFEQDALEVLTKKKNLRLLETGEMTPKSPAFLIKSVTGGILVQERDLGIIKPDDLKVVSDEQPEADDVEGLLFAWKVVKWVKSNAIVYTTKDQTLGIGAGQMSRVDSARFAAQKAQKSLEGAYMASDAFFPFRDSVDFAAEQGIRAIIQPGGSVRDQESIDAANERHIIMVFTGMRHFRH